MLSPACCASSQQESAYELHYISTACPGSSKHIPVNEIPERLEELPSDLETPICCFCKIGQRSGLAKRFLEQVGTSDSLECSSLLQAVIITRIYSLCRWGTQTLSTGSPLRRYRSRWTQISFRHEGTPPVQHVCCCFQSNPSSIACTVPPPRRTAHTVSKSE